ncbi:MAG: ABC transporter substrate-binding protein [Acidimicrobiales bacterium]
MPLLGLVALLSAACSRAAGPVGVVPTAQPPRRVVKLAVLGPLEGGLGPLGLGIRNSVDLAVRMANDAKTIRGWRLELAPAGDGQTAAEASAAADRLAADPAVLAVVVAGLGEGSSGELSATLASAGLVEVSVAATDAGPGPAVVRSAPEPPAQLTSAAEAPTAAPRPEGAASRSGPQPKGEGSRTASASVSGRAEPGSGSGPDATVGGGMSRGPGGANRFRLAATAQDQGLFLAGLVADLGRRRAALIRGDAGEGEARARGFADGFVSTGAEVVAIDHRASPAQQTIVDLAGQVATAGVDVVVATGSAATGALVSAELKRAGLATSVVRAHPLDDLPSGTAGPGPDIIYSPSLDAAALARATRDPGPGRFAADYLAAGYRDPAGLFGPLAFDAANVAIAALSRALNGQDQLTATDRGEVGAAVADTEMRGVTGMVSFDPLGTRVNPLMVAVAGATSGGGLNPSAPGPARVVGLSGLEPIG